jgi:hypothetical protein
MSVGGVALDNQEAFGDVPRTEKRTCFDEGRKDGERKEGGMMEKQMDYKPGVTDKIEESTSDKYEFERSEILQERESMHGDFHKNCTNTCDLFYVRTGIKLKPKHVPIFMTCLKQARFFQHPEVEDHVKDGQGYEELLREEILEENH